MMAKHTLQNVVARLMRAAFMAGYEAALNNATGEMDGSLSWPHYEPPEEDWKRIQLLID